jgi:segregation and condensation protein A
MLATAAISYTVVQPAFNGPLELLLQLIERRELDITVVSLAQIADEYLAQVRALKEPDPQALSEFLLIGARLLLIKSRALLPQIQQAAERPSDDNAEALAEQLRAYQRYKAAAALLREWEQGRRCYVRTAPPPTVNSVPQPLDSSVDDLLRALRHRLQLRLPLDEPTVPLPAPKRLTVAEASQLIRARLARQAWVDFVDLVPLQADRVTVLVLFWAILEMLKRREVVVEQHELFGAIGISGRADAPADE